ncbi:MULTISPECIES: DUF1499 domain-containing protein [Marinobacter]|uniref:DUF1499 domain-containing protein n=1 Tax=Marinobacter TaxID=2742 RepID=UPI001D06E04B|nr:MULTISPECIES: DUF1499 domain-containing protein [Marinobacter]MCG8517835.1 DUF1499 domain-containing protein [Pseudomonadales bacterium]MCK7565478.1 DUF1499 domain-containing protein [Marinobacter xestospongiae]UDL06379.1 DUF1499 domain-containing protein [Marinobacter sp. CA1]
MNELFSLVRLSWLRLLVVVLCSVWVVGCSSTPPDNLGLQNDQRLAPCPETPNCVCSVVENLDSEHYIAPLVGDLGTWNSLPVLVSSQPNLRIVEQGETYLRAEATSNIFRFVDDVEFHFLPEEGLIHIRSASRVGYSDFGVNRERLEEIRRRLRLAVRPS